MPQLPRTGRAPSHLGFTPWTPVSDSHTRQILEVGHHRADSRDYDVS